MVSRLVASATVILQTLFLMALCGTSSAQVWNQFECGGDLTGTGCTWNSQIIGNGAVTLAKQANLAANSIQGNPTGSAATPQALSPLQVGIMGSYMYSVDAASTANVASLSGPQTIDGISLIAGSVVLLKNQGTASQNGPWVVAAGAWTRPINFPSGFILPAQCHVVFFIPQGTANKGTSWALSTTVAITIDTTSQSWNTATIGTATAATLGLVKVTNSAIAASVTTSPTSGGGAVGDCASFSDVTGSIGDNGNNNVDIPGPCLIGDANGHIAAAPNSQTGPSISGTGCTLAAGTNTDNAGEITAAGVDTCTLAFGTAFATAPHCAVAPHSTTVLPTMSLSPTTAHAIFVTAAAGTFEYLCY